MSQARNASRTLARLRPIFMIATPSAFRNRATRSASGKVPGATTSTSSPHAIGIAAAPQAPHMPVTPGTIDVAYRDFRRMKRCMNEP